jgi:hypothetical protein
MFKKLVFLVVLLVLVPLARAETLVHYSFDNGEGEDFPAAIQDETGNVTFQKVLDGGTLTYGEANPTFNITGTSAHFTRNSTLWRDAVLGSDILDLDGPAYTVELFIKVNDFENSPRGHDVIFKKMPQDYVMEFWTENGEGWLKFSHFEEEDASTITTAAGTIDLDQWYHIAFVFDSGDTLEPQKIYIDGAKAAAGGVTDLNPGSDGPVGIAAMTRTNLSRQDWLAANIDEFRISDEALDPSEFLIHGLDKGIASNPRPRNKTTDWCPDEVAELCWKPGKLASSHDVYFGTDEDDVRDATTVVTLGVYEGNQEPNCWPTSGIALDTTYYWRIDEVNDSNGATWKGSVWNFTTSDGTASDPSPTDGVTGAPPNDVTLSWTPGCLADTHNIYFGTSESDVNNGTGGTDKGSQSPGYDPGDLDQYTVYYWRVDEVNGANTWTGPVWSFKTGKGGILVYFDFEGTEGTDLPDPITDNTASVDFTTYIADGDDAGTVKYGEPNPFYNPSGTSMAITDEAGIFRDDTGDNDIMRLDGMAYTIETWMKADTFPSYDDNVLIKKYSSYSVLIGGDDELIKWYHGSSLGTENKVKRGSWYHIAAVFDSEADPERKLYVDGVLVGSADAVPLPADNNDPVSIGFMRRPAGSSDDFFNGKIDEFAILDVPLGPGTFLFFPGPEWAGSPYPAKGTIRVDPNVVLSWTPGTSADSHDVYFGTDYNDVKAGDASVLEADNLEPNEFDPCGPGNPLELGVTYYWRVDEQGAGGPWEGLVWSFTVQSAILDVNMVAWYKLDEADGSTAEDSSGYDQHANVDTDDPDWDPNDGRWDGSLGFDDDTDVECPDGPEGVLGTISDGISISLWLKDAWRQEEDNWVFGSGNSGSIVEAAVVDEPNRDVYFRAGNDTNDVITWDLDGANAQTISGWHMWTFVKNETSGEISIYFDGFVVESNSVVDATLSGVRNDQLRFGVARSSSNSFIGRIDDARVFNKGLSAQEVAALFRGGEVELAWAPDPFDGKQDVPVDANLSWQPGDYAVEHDVYLGTNWDDVNSADTSSLPVYRGRQDPCEYDPPGILEMGTTYYWRIDEVNDNDPNTWRGNIWTFTVANFLVIDDFEDYDTSDNKIFNTWEDGNVNLTGSFLDLGSEPFDPVHIGIKSMLYVYDNTIKWDWDHYWSEAKLPFSPAKDFTEAGVKVLTLYFYGTADNDANDTEELYVGLEGSLAEVRYSDDHGNDNNDIRLEEWTEWNIPISEFSGVDPCAVTGLLIGFGDRDNTNKVGGDGVVYFDDVRLNRPRCLPEYQGGRIAVAAARCQR